MILEVFRLLYFIFLKKSLLLRGFRILTMWMSKSFLLTFLLFINLKIYNVQTTLEFGIVFEEVVEVNFEPNDKSEVLFEIHEGTKVEVIENFDMDWLKIKLSNGQTGWVIKNQIKII